MNEDEDLELQALQRRLDDAFQTTRPRAAFEDELWSKMQARRPLWSRVSEFFTGLVGSIREAPAVPAAAVAGSRYAGTFGRLPVPAAAATNAPPKVANPSHDTGGALANPNAYAGPINVVWAGQFSVSLTNAPVYRYFEPSSADADQFATSIGASGR